MKKGDKKKQQKALKKRTERKQARKQENVLQALSLLRYVRQARSYPIEGCWVQQDWDEGGLAVVVIARRQPNGNLVFGNYLVDYYCLGVKDTYFNADVPRGQFQNDALPTMYRAAGKPIKISPDLAHEIIYGSIEYARQFGFRPHRDFDESQSILDPPDAHPRTGKVKFGKDGKPFFISGPHDNVEAIRRQLERTAGAGNYDFLIQIGGPPPDEWEDDTWEGDEEIILDAPHEALSDEAQQLLDEDVVEAKKQIGQQHLTGEVEQDKRIAQVLASVDPDDEMAAFDAWDEYLTQHLVFPIEAEVAEFQAHGPLRAGDLVQVLRISAVEDLYGILVRVRARRGEYDFPLCDLEVVDKASPNYQVVDDYAVWFANR